MLMEWEDWILFFIETPKYFLITYGILGFAFKKGVKKYLLLLYLLLLPVLCYMEMDTQVYRTLWFLLLIVVYFQGDLGKKVQVFLLEYCVVISVDNFFWCIFAAFTSPEQMRPGTMKNYIGDFFSMLMWLLPVFLLRKQKKRIHECIEQLSVKWMCLLIGTFIICGFVLGVQEMRILGEMTSGMELGAIIIEAVAVIAIIIAGIVLIYTIYSKEQLKREKEIQGYLLEEQQTYYHRRMQQEEQLRSFRHDIGNHLRAVHALQREGKLEESRQYLESLSGKLEAQRMVTTGNDIADYLINGTIQELEEKGALEKKIRGRFPPDISLANEEVTVLLGNALDNAKEALLQIEGRRELLILIENSLPDLYITVGNTSKNELKEKDGIFETTKEDKENHGYGVRNMRQVVERHEGEIKWERRSDWFQIEMHLKL